MASGSYYEAAIAWAETRGIVNGFGGGLFRPNAPITREQFVAILYRYAAYKGLQTTASASLSAFADAASVSRLGRRRGPLGRRHRPASPPEPKQPPCCTAAWPEQTQKGCTQSSQKSRGCVLCYVWKKVFIV